jgi:phosphatidylinositol-4,5-bisphosphate 3-kinase
MPDVFTFPHDQRLKSTGVSPSDCKVFSSKKAPILLSTLNSQINAPNYEVLFKMGDDLKQDILTLQILRLFDKWWLEAGLDLKMSPYQVLNTQDLIGYIEFVQNSDTMKEIFDKYGGTLSTFDKYIIMKFLEANNRGIHLEIALENFRRSVAGYCLLTYVMGVGDRHISNYMVNKDGKFFHIDFGHILGNFKKKFFIKRERSKVAFTKEMMYTIGKDYEEYFYKLCFYGMSILRKKSHLLLNLLWMLLSADMPNLRTKRDLNWVKDSLLLNGNDTEASEKFKKVLEEGYNDTYRRFDNWFHRLRHGKKKQN